MASHPSSIPNDAAYKEALLLAANLLSRASPSPPPNFEPSSLKSTATVSSAASRDSQTGETFVRQTSPVEEWSQLIAAILRHAENQCGEENTEEDLEEAIRLLLCTARASSPPATPPDRTPVLGPLAGSLCETGIELEGIEIAEESLEAKLASTAIDPEPPALIHDNGEDQEGQAEDLPPPPPTEADLQLSELTGHLCSHLFLPPTACPPLPPTTQTDGTVAWTPVTRTELLEVEREFLAVAPEFPEPSPPTSPPPTQVEEDLDCFNLPVIYKKGWTGFEASKDFTPAIGSVIAGRYRVKEELGTAAFSTAYRCEDLTVVESEGGDEDDEDDAEVCLKIIKNTKDFFDQSLDEIKILNILKNSGDCDEHRILRMKEYFYFREHLVIVTELLKLNLYEFSNFIRESGEAQYFTLPRLAYIAYQCLLALDYVHSLGLMHCDVKPENILLASYSHVEVKVIDFGSGCYTTDHLSSYIQSRSYRAPEVVLGLPYDGRIDIWSLGCVVAEMANGGNVLFENDHITTMLARIQAICGTFPRHMITRGKESASHFTSIGLLYCEIEAGEGGEGGEGDDSAANVDKVDIITPVPTTLTKTLGYEEGAMNEIEEQFVDLISSLLQVDPEKRPTAKEALQHPLILKVTDGTFTEGEIFFK